MGELFWRHRTKADDLKRCRQNLSRKGFFYKFKGQVDPLKHSISVVEKKPAGFLSLR